jgi:hypothetical protein
MAIVAIVFGVLMVLVGMLGYGTTGGLYPFWVGGVLAICGLLAAVNEARRMLWMHIAVTVGVVGLVVAGVIAGRVFAKWNTPAAATYPRIVLHEPSAVALLCLVFVALCVRSFIAARRTRAT